MRKLSAAVILLVSACSPRTEPVRLLRTSTAGPELRLHVATFDAKDGESYNRDNCETAAKLFQAQPGVEVRYYCDRVKP